MVGTCCLVCPPAADCRSNSREGNRLCCAVQAEQCAARVWQSYGEACCTVGILHLLAAQVAAAADGAGCTCSVVCVYVGWRGSRQGVVAERRIANL